MYSFSKSISTHGPIFNPSAMHDTLGDFKVAYSIFKIIYRQNMANTCIVSTCSSYWLSFWVSYRDRQFHCPYLRLKRQLPWCVRTTVLANRIFQWSSHPYSTVMGRHSKTLGNMSHIDWESDCRACFMWCNSQMILPQFWKNRDPRERSFRTEYSIFPDYTIFCSQTDWC